MAKKNQQPKPPKMLMRHKIFKNGDVTGFATNLTEEQYHALSGRLTKVGLSLTSEFSGNLGAIRWVGRLNQPGTVDYKSAFTHIFNRQPSKM